MGRLRDPVHYDGVLDALDAWLGHEVNRHRYAEKSSARSLRLIG
jgi:hypothetical protein